MTQTSPGTERGGRQDKNMPEYPKPAHETQKTPENPHLGTQKNGKLWGAAVRKPPVHGCASRFVYVMLDPPCKRAS